MTVTDLFPWTFRTEPGILRQNRQSRAVKCPEIPSAGICRCSRCSRSRCRPCCSSAREIRGCAAARIRSAGGHARARADRRATCAGFSAWHGHHPPSDTWMRERLDEVAPRDLRCCFTRIHSALQRGKVLEDWTVLDGHLPDLRRRHRLEKWADRHHSSHGRGEVSCRN